MARKKISEFRAKTILYSALDIPYSGIEVDTHKNIDEQIYELDDSNLYVVKVDQGVKKRGKQGLIKVKIQKAEVKSEIQKLKKLGFEYFLIEEFVPHEQSAEKYLAIERTREGLSVSFSDKGGVDIEENSDSIQSWTIDATDMGQLPKGIPDQVRNDIVKLVEVFEKNFFSFLELNPFLSGLHPSPLPEGEGKSGMVILDAAVEVDSAAEFFVDSWTSADFRSYSKNKKTPEEDHVAELADKSQASFSLTVLNPNGSLFMLLSGGGASIVLADEAYNQGKGEEVANYGEYSGNPNLEETYLYTKEILSLLFNSKAPKKILIVAGGVANFTDVRATFRGVIKAIAEDAEKLRAEKVKVFVRRGGPNQAEGLKMMADFLKKEDLFGEVEGPDKPLTMVVDKALKQIS